LQLPSLRVWEYDRASSVSTASVMQTSHRYRFPNVQHPQDSAYPASSSLLHLRSGSSAPASPLTVLAKTAAPALLTAILWLQGWIGTTASITVAILALAALIALPRLQAASSGQENWAAKICFGERIFLNRLLIPIPSTLGARITTLYLVFWAGLIIALMGGVSASVLLSVTGLVVAYSAQLVYFQKLIELFRQMNDKVPLYRFWSSVPGNDN